MPGTASLADTEYYAHPRNAFWPVMQALFGGSTITYAEKCQILVSNHIIVWDVLNQCIRHGSLDANIRKDSVVCNNFDTFLDLNPDISLIAFNGKASEKLFRQHVVPKLDMHFTTGSAASQPEYGQADSDADSRTIQLVSLPSTSPAMASLKLEEKIVTWRKALSPAAENKRITDDRV